MRTRILVLFLALLSVQANAADLITRWLVFTNAPIGNTNSVTLNGSARTYTNTVSGSPATLIAQTNVIGWSATNTANQLTTYRVSYGHLITVGTNYLAVRGAVGENLTLSINACCFGYVTNSTQTVASPTFVYRLPLTVEAATNQVSIASLAVQGESTSSTNAFGTNSTALSNAIVKGASPLQTIQSPLFLAGRTAVSNGFFATNMFTSASTNINPVNSNAVNYGNAIRSEGPGGNSFQAGSNALALGLRGLSIGNGSFTTNTDALAVGTGAIATNDDTVAVGNSSRASGNRSVAFGRSAVSATNESIALGYSALAQGFQSMAFGEGSIAGYGGGALTIGNEGQALQTHDIAIGYTAFANAGDGIAIGNGATVTSSNSVAIGKSATATTTNQIRLGTSTHTVSIPGVVTDPALTNATLRGTNIINGQMVYTPVAVSSLANGYNSAVALNQSFIRYTGPSAAYTNVGFSAANKMDGRRHLLQFDNPGLSFTILHDSGLDAGDSNRVYTGTGALVNSTNNPVFAEIIRDENVNRWRLLWIR